jgi:P4 family phage/plasmid primase-like protien
MEHDFERIAKLQEWAGYLLLADTSQQKFLALEGEGANGKSVFLAGLEAMLGSDNVSHIPLEMFGQRFHLTETVGKLANIAADCGDLDRVAEGHLKSFTSGDRMFFDRKGLPGIDAAPTARMLLAFNNRPRFSDRSSGLWRRMDLIPFRVEIGESMRVYGMDKPQFWADLGELPGVFNWAVAGLHRLRQQKKFTKSAICEAALADYRTEINPARAFLNECCQASIFETIATNELYTAYKKWCNDNGYRPLGERQFGKELFRVFPATEKKRIGTGDNRFMSYHGINLIKEKSF